MGPTALEAGFGKFLFTPSAVQEASIVLMGLQFELEDPSKGDGRIFMDRGSPVKPAGPWGQG